MHSELTRRLARCTVASCRCMTKTPEVQYHAEDCLYRVLNEAIAVIDTLTPNSTKADALFEQWFEQHYGDADLDHLKPLLRTTWGAALETLGQLANASDKVPSPPAFRAALFGGKTFNTSNIE